MIFELSLREVIVVVILMIIMCAIIYQIGWRDYEALFKEEVDRLNSDANKLNNLLNGTYIRPIEVIM